MQKHRSKRPLKAFIFSMQGLRVLWQEESFRYEMALLAIGMVALYFSPVSLGQVFTFGALMVAVMVVETINTALERIADKIDSSINPFTRDVKDLGSAAVFLMLVVALGYFAYALIDGYYYAYIYDGMARLDGTV